MKDALWEKYRNGDYDGVLKDARDHLLQCGAFDAIHLVGLCLIEKGDVAKGVDFLCMSLSLTQGSEGWFANAAWATYNKSLHDASLMFSMNGRKEHPTSHILAFVHGLALLNLHHREAAIQAFEDALKLEPTFYHAAFSKAFALQLQGQHEDAMALYQSIEGAAPDDQQEINNNIAWSLMETGRRQEALDWFKAKCEQTSRVRFNESILELGLGHWPQAWELYKTRREHFVESDDCWKSVKKPLANNLYDMTAKRVLLFAEQGFGDTIQFIRYAESIALLAKHVIIKVPRALARLASYLTMPGQFTVTADWPEPKDYDVGVPMMDCPALFCTAVDTIPAHVPYFKGPLFDKETVPWTGKLHVGLLWAGASRTNDLRAYAIDERRSIPWDMFAPLLNMSDRYDFVSLQMPEGGKHVIDDGRLLQPLQDEFDFLDTARVVDDLDLVIAVDSAVAHLAGALGKPVWLLNRFDGCWRWFWDGRTTSPWYPTMRIFHQPAPGDWQSVMADVNTQLGTYFEGLIGHEPSP